MVGCRNRYTQYANNAPRYLCSGHDDGDDSLITYDPAGSWRHHVQSFPIRRPPRPRAVCRRPAATPAWPFPRFELKEGKKGTMKEYLTTDSSRKERKERALRSRHLLLLLLAFQFLIFPPAHACCSVLARFR